MPVRVLGLYSPAPQSGKSTVAEFLRPYGYTPVPFAFPLKRMTQVFLEELGYPAHTAAHLVYHAKQTHIPEAGVTVRHMLQSLGTEWGRDCIHPDIWLRCWEVRAKKVLESGQGVVVEDCRYPNEAAMVRRLGGQLWCIERSSAVNDTLHSSEGGLNDYELFDLRICNNSSLLDLQTTVQQKLALPVLEGSRA